MNAKRAFIVNKRDGDRIWMTKTGAAYFHFDLSCIQLLNSNLEWRHLTSTVEVFNDLNDTQIALLHRMGLLEQYAANVEERRNM